MKKTLFIVNLHSLVSRNILRSDVFKLLKEQANIHIVMFVDEFKKDFFESEFHNDRLTIIGISSSKLTSSFRFIFAKYINYAMINTYTLRLRKLENLQKHKSIFQKISYLINRFIVLFFSPLKFLHTPLRWINFTLFQTPELFEYFKTYKPNLVFVGDILSELDPQFIKAAKKYKVPTIGMVRSWDNTTTKGLLTVLPDHFIVNNEVIKEEAIKIHGVKPSTIFVGGIPQFDTYFKKEVSTRDEFLTQMGIPLDKRIILFAPAGQILSDTEWQICEMFKAAFKDGRLPKSFHILVRSHPLDHAILDKFTPDENFTIDNPGVMKWERLKATEFSQNDVLHLSNSLFHSDIVIHYSSTIGIDSLVFDKPQIMIAFDGWEERAYIKSVRRYHDEDHMQKYLGIAPSTVVNNEKELFNTINTYISSPETKQSERQKALEAQVCKLDGNSGQRIGQFIIDALSRSSNNVLS